MARNGNTQGPSTSSQNQNTPVTPAPEPVIASGIIVPTQADIDRLAAEGAPRAVADPDAAEDDELPPSEQAALNLAAAAGAARGGFSTADLQELGRTIAAGVSAGMAANAPRRKIGIAEYDPKTAFLPNKKDAVALTRACFQNGAQMRPVNMFPEEIRLLNGITHSGRYIDRLVEVVLVPNGAEDEVHLRYNCKTIDQRFELKGKFRDLKDMLTQIAEAQAQERAEDERVGALRAERNRR